MTSIQKLENESAYEKGGEGGGDVERMKEVVEEERKKKKEVEMKSNKRAE